jgi:Tfp pilus assembly protein PilV
VKRALDLAAGFAYIEVLVAVLLLALCTLPAANAVRNGLNAADAAPKRAAALRCMRDRMEAVLAEPYDKLLAAQNGKQPATKYSDEVAVGGCVVRKVYIDVYRKSDKVSEETASSTALLRVDVVSPGTSYSFTTLVAP